MFLQIVFRKFKAHIHGKIYRVNLKVENLTP